MKKNYFLISFILINFINLLIADTNIIVTNPPNGTTLATNSQPILTGTVQNYNAVTVTLTGPNGIIASGNSENSSGSTLPGNWMLSPGISLPNGTYTVSVQGFPTPLQPATTSTFTVQSLFLNVTFPTDSNNVAPSINPIFGGTTNAFNSVDVLVTDDKEEFIFFSGKAVANAQGNWAIQSNVNLEPATYLFHASTGNILAPNVLFLVTGTASGIKWISANKIFLGQLAPEGSIVIGMAPGKGDLIEYIIPDPLILTAIANSQRIYKLVIPLLTLGEHTLIIKVTSATTGKTFSSTFTLIVAGIGPKPKPTILDVLTSAILQKYICNNFI